MVTDETRDNNAVLPRTDPAMAIELTPAAAARMRRFLGQRPSALGVRFGIKNRGCSGYGYTVDLADEVRPDDTVLELDGVKLVVDAKALPLVDGTRIDYARHGLDDAFVFDNPHASATCGCGESFTVAQRGG